MNKQNLLNRLNDELAAFKREATASELADKAQDYAGDFELTIERLESRGKVMAAEWLIQVVSEFDETQHGRWVAEDGSYGYGKMLVGDPGLTAAQENTLAELWDSGRYDYFYAIMTGADTSEWDDQV